ncbi:MAG: hypothetical protein KBA15_06250 [Spirochaetes bacterium]|jgi:hypothetical protein|nr:hypothetical protein [Spirochaetota bacterium]
MNRFTARFKGQATAFLILVAVLSVFAVISDEMPYRRFLGSLDPALAFAIVAIAGYAALAFLSTRGWFCNAGKTSGVDVIKISSCALVLGITIAAADSLIRFPRDMNVPFPQSLLFYPVIGFIVEVVFHVLPLFLLLAVIEYAVMRKITEKTVLYVLIPVALIETVFQAYGFRATGTYSLWGALYVGVHVFVINIIGLLLFRRHGFIMMYLFRLMYYFLWHILWGHLRLSILFQ